MIYDDKHAEPEYISVEDEVVPDVVSEPDFGDEPAPDEIDQPSEWEQIGQMVGEIDTDGQLHLTLGRTNAQSHGLRWVVVLRKAFVRHDKGRVFYGATPLDAVTRAHMSWVDNWPRRG